MGEPSGKAQKDGGGYASILNLRAASSPGENPTKSVSNAIMPPCMDGVRKVAKSDLFAARKLPSIELALGAKKWQKPLRIAFGLNPEHDGANALSEPPILWIDHLNPHL